ncbi:MAG: hypothetical protein DCC67_21010 [Planctomycetota bacterium]|nr:MAG: hypothetical protein DCC67_21010 [Planctomycetota bacterium]
MCVVVGATSAPAATLHTDDFETGTTTLNWLGGSSPTYIASGGPAGADDAFLRITPNPFREHLAVFNTSSAWTGNYQSLGAAAVHVDLMAPANSAPLQIRLVLFSAATSVLQPENRWTSTVAQTTPNDGVWRRYTFALDEAALTRVQGADNYAQLMANVNRVMFRYDVNPPSSGGDPVSGNAELNLDNIQLAAASPLAGDFNGDGAVDGADLTDADVGWAARFGADLNGHDFLIWQRNFGQPGGVAPAATAVPEPAAALLVLGLAVLGLLPVHPAATHAAGAGRQFGD